MSRKPFIPALPKDWAENAVTANKEVYEIDIERNAKRSCEVVYSGR